MQRHNTLCRFLTDVLHVEQEAATETACKMEHVIPPKIIEQFTAYADQVADRQGGEEGPPTAASLHKDHRTGEPGS